MTISQNDYPMTPIGKIECPYEEKFAVPRQPGLVPSIQGTVIIEPPFHDPAAFMGLEDFSHLWLLFRFHQNLPQGWKPSVRPPRLGGNKKIGVFATRSSFRPNGLGMSAVQLLDIEFASQQTRLTIAGMDLVSGTPIYDIKPYIAYSDAIAEAKSGFVAGPPTATSVTFSPDVEHWFSHHSLSMAITKSQLIEILSQDPRPAYRKSQSVDSKEYGISLSGLNIKWCAKPHGIVVLSIDAHKNKTPKK